MILWFILHARFIISAGSLICLRVSAMRKDGNPFLRLSIRERSSAVEECSTGDRGAAGSSLTGITALWSLSKTHLSQLSTGSTQEDPSLFNRKMLMGRKESNQTKQ